MSTFKIVNFFRKHRNIQYPHKKLTSLLLFNLLFSYFKFIIDKYALAYGYTTSGDIHLDFSVY